ncbi:uncharacterized protein Dwil_GK26775 [Drosophila willistoni]|uniref:DUF4780 domain-containing protein n=1 Tax=Drosophila willistoni TaxID=7260 RepID=A0A0Q9WWV0_DROWI|nr:uncharacterized protein LOC26528777 [Drosophila willistoni]KRG00365.1 uncharacterized protein Dwil_GK26775 [Drosophila willistoni]
MVEVCAAPILPENSPFVLVVSSLECAKDFCNLLEDFFDTFQDYRNVGCLESNEVTLVAHYNGRLFVAAANEDTMDWVGRHICSKGPYEAIGPTNFLHLTAARVAWPKIKFSLQRIFTLLERQNSDIEMEKRAAVNRNNLPSKADENVTEICLNEQVEIWMDAESAKVIKKRCNHLKLSFWMIEFEFRN